MNVQSKALINHIIDNKYQTNYYSVTEDADFKVAGYLASLSKSDFKLLISDKSWNSYPTYTINRIGNSARDYFQILFRATRHLIYSNNSLKKMIIDHSTGIFRISAIKICLGQDKVIAAKKSLKQGDSRARKCAVRILPINDIRKHYPFERESSARRIIVDRIGFVEMSEIEEKKSTEHYYLNRNFLNNKFSIQKIEEVIDQGFVVNNLKINKTSIIQKLCYYLSPEESVFFLNLIKDNSVSRYDSWVIKAFMDKVATKSSK